MTDIASGQARSESSSDHALATAHLLSDLRNRTISGGLITACVQGAQFVITLGSTIVLARLLNPHDYGLVAMVGTVLGFLRMFSDTGLTTVTIQREGITNAQVSNLFWVNAAVAASFTILIVASASLIASFYHEPALVSVTYAMSATFLLAGLTAQHSALLQRQMRFVAIASIQLGSMMASLVVGIAMAWRGYSYWALVGMQLAQSATTMVLTWVASGWRPAFPARRQGTKALVRFGADLTATNLVWSLARNVDAVVIGRMYGSESLGLYSRAGSLLNRPLEQLLAPVNAVLVPMLSRLQRDPDRYRRAFLQIFEAFALGSFFLTGIFLALSYELTVFALGHRWEMAAGILAAFAPSAIFVPLNSVTSSLLASQGRAREWLVGATLSGIATAASFVVGAWFGPFGVAISYSIGGLGVVLPIFYFIAGRQGPVRTRDLWRASLRQLPVWLAVMFATLAVRRWIGEGPLLVKLAVCGLAGLAAGAAFIWVYLPARRTAMYLVGVARAFRLSA